MVNDNLKKQVMELIRNSFVTMLNNVRNSNDIHNTIKGLYITYLETVLSDDGDAIANLNRSECGPAQILEIVSYITQNLVNKQQQNIEVFIQTLINKTISAHICLTVKRINSVQQSFMSSLSYTPQAEAAKNHIGVGLNDYDSELMPMYRGAKRDVDGVQNNNFNNSGSMFGGVNQMNQQQNNLTNPFSTGFSNQQNNNHSGSIPHYLKEDVDVGPVANMPASNFGNQNTQNNFTTPISTPTQQPQQQVKEPKIQLDTFKPNTKYHYAILKNPYSTTFKISEGELKLENLSFDIGRLAVTNTSNAVATHWLIDRNDYVSGNKPIIQTTTKMVEDKQVLVEKETYHQFVIQEPTPDIFNGINAQCVLDSYITRMISYAAKNYIKNNEIPNAYWTIVKTKKVLPFNEAIADFVNFIINAYSNHESLVALSSLLVSSYKQIADAEVTKTNKVTNTLAKTFLDVIDNEIETYIQNIFYRNMSCIDITIDNFCEDYIEAVKVASTNSEVAEVLQLLETKSKNIAKELVLSINDNDITIEQKHMVLSVDVVFQELEIEFYNNDYPSVVTNESKTMKNLVNSIGQIMKDMEVKTCVLVTLDNVQLYITEAYWAPGQYTISTR